MHILFVVPDLSGRSGWSRYALDLGRELTRRGHRITAIVHRRTHVGWCDELPLLSRETSYVSNLAACILTARRINGALRQLKPDVLHFVAEPYALTLPFIRRRGLRCVMTIHSTYGLLPLKLGGLTRYLMRRTYRLLDGILSVSEFSKEFLHTHEPRLFDALHLGRRIHVLPNAIDVRGSSVPSKKHAAGPKRILSVGAVKNRKGYLQAIEACATLREKTNVSFTYDIVGSLSDDPGYVEKLRQKIAAHHLTEHVQLHGIVDDEKLKAFYEHADLFLLLSLQEGYHAEGFGLVFLEASARGVPVIGPNTGGCPEAIADGRSGYVCDPHDAVGVSKKMEEILIHHRIDAGACRGWAEEHSIEKACDRLLKEYSIS